MRENIHHVLSVDRPQLQRMTFVPSMIRWVESTHYVHYGLTLFPFMRRRFFFWELYTLRFLSFLFLSKLSFKEGENEQSFASELTATRLLPNQKEDALRSSCPFKYNPDKKRIYTCTSRSVISTGVHVNQCRLNLISPQAVHYFSRLRRKCNRS